jgi:hypothetical protein
MMRQLEEGQGVKVQRLSRNLESLTSDESEPEGTLKTESASAQAGMLGTESDASQWPMPDDHEDPAELSMREESADLQESIWGTGEIQISCRAIHVGISRFL